jgi:DNA-binding NarL/FixJ family response regulator
MHSDQCTKIIVVDDHPLVRKGISETVAACTEFRIVGEAGAGDALLPLLREQPADIVITDLKMPQTIVHELVRDCQALYPDLKFVVLSAYLSTANLQLLRKVNIHGYIVKDEAPASLLQALRVVAEGGQWQSPSVARRLARLSRQDRQPRFDELTPRETEVLKALAQAKDNQAIADMLMISKETVRRYITAIYSKLGVANRIEAVLWAAENMPTLVARGN